METLKNNLETITHTLSCYLKTTNPIKIMAVAKQQDKSRIKQAQKLGLIIFGENRVQEAEKKMDIYGDDIELHLIGHLQSNKAKKAVDLFDVIQSVDSYKIAEKINQAAKKINKNQRIYIQVNIGEDPNKHGLQNNKVEETAIKISFLKHVKIEGIMTILPYKTTAKEKEELYVKTKKLRDKIHSQIETCLETSMGMSLDYLHAAQCGATMVRIGTALFGTRMQ